MDFQKYKYIKQLIILNINKSMKKTIKELKELVSLFEYRKLFTNDSIIMVGDIEKLKNLINKL